MRRLYRQTQATRQVSLENRVDALERRYRPPDLDTVADCFCCLPPPGSLAIPAYGSPGDEPQFDNVHFPGGVIVARITEAMMSTFDVGEDVSSPSRNAEGMNAGGGSAYDDVTKQWVFRPVDDFGVLPGVSYGVWFSFRYVGTGELHLESRSNNTVATADIWSNGGGRHPNSGTTPSTLEWADATDQTAEYPRLDYYGMFPWGGQNAYGDWPLQLGGSSGMSFEAGEAITVRPFSPDGTPTVYLDHLVFMPTFPMGMVDPTDLDTGTPNYSSGALEVIGYYVASGQPGSVTEPTDYGSIFGGASTVDDSQSLSTFWDPTGHFTIAFFDESDAQGLFTDVGGLHVYVLCRTNRSDYSGSATFGRPSGHVTCFDGSSPVSDIQPPQSGAWVWAYAGEQALGDGPQGSFGMIQWLADGENFSAPNGTTDENGVRTAFVAYVPYAPCEAGDGGGLLT